MTTDYKAFRKILAEKLGLPAKEIDSLVSAIRELIIENSEALRGLAIPGFGTFVTVRYEEKIVEDLTSGQKLLFPPEIILEFFPSTIFKKKFSVEEIGEPISQLPDISIMGMPAIAEYISKREGISTEMSIKYIKGFFGLLEDLLVEGNSVDIKGFGEFRNVAFKPSKTLAEDINEPFSMFSPVELSSAIDENAFMAIGGAIAQEDEKDAFEESAIESDHNSVTSIIPIANPPAVSSVPATIPELEQKNEITPYEGEISYTDDSGRGLRTLYIILAIVLIIAMFVVGYFLGLKKDYKIGSEINVVDTLRVVMRDTIYVSQDTSVLPESEVEIEKIVEQIVPTSNQQKNAESVQKKVENEVKPRVENGVRYDVVTPTHYLTSMARTYYGNSEYWVFIYLANESKLGNPDHIPPGTEVVIPPFERFAESDNDSINLAAARWMADEIYNRYTRRNY